MAKCEIKMPDKFLEKLSGLGKNFDAVAETVLQEGGRIVLDQVRSNLQSAVGKNTKTESRSTGELERSLGLSGAKVDKNGNTNVKIGFSEPRSDGESNAKIANILEYGRHNMPAKPFLKPAASASKSACISAMQKKLEEALK